ncbi:MAG: hypothetical protein JOY69_02215 [Candidatus Eremiobacteraeota bacterium]|nr:hypothetical protein [Candidatus Eremiobacteraeota bacterium]
MSMLLAAILAVSVAYANPGSANRSSPSVQPVRALAPAASVDKVKKKRPPPPFYFRYARQMQSCDNVHLVQTGEFADLRAFGGGLNNCWPYNPDWLDPYWL